MAPTTMIIQLLLQFVLLISAVAAQNASSTTSHSTTETPSATSAASNATLSASVSGTVTFSVTVPSSAASSDMLASSTVTAAYPSLSGVSTCVTNCLQAAVAQTNCTSIVDTGCYCGQPRVFANSTMQCVLKDCEEQIISAESLAQQFCQVSAVTLSFQSVSLPSTVTTSLPPSVVSSTLSSPTSTTSSGAMQRVGCSGTGLIVAAWMVPFVGLAVL